jgi:hypothetical protein
VVVVGHWQCLVAGRSSVGILGHRSRRLGDGWVASHYRAGMTVRPVYRPFVVEQFIAAPRPIVWSALLDFLGSEATGGYEREGDPPPHGPGALKVFALDHWTLVEETLTLEPPWRRVYAITGGAPVRSYQGTTLLLDEGSGTRLVWSCLIEPLIEGGSEAYEARVRTAIPKAIAAIERAATTATASANPVTP